MKVYTGKNSGFCFGVRRAIAEAEKLCGKNDYILGEIIHNDEVIERLEKKGIVTVKSLSDERLKSGDTVLIRTHGEPKSTFIKAKEMGLNIIDCTCPFVRAIQEKAEKYKAEGYKIVIIGNAKHPEVIGINGWCDGEAYITQSADDILKLRDDKICVLVQTTYSEENFNKIIEKIDGIDLKKVDIFKTICYTTIGRQSEARYLSKKCDAMIVVGGADSNNTRELFDICAGNCKNVFRIVRPSEFNYEKIKNFNKVGIVLGASTPVEQFREVIFNMENITEDVITTEVADVQEKEQVVETAPVQEEVKVEVSENVVENKAEKSDDKPKSEMEKAFANIKPSRNLHIGQIVTATISSVKDDGLTVTLKDIKSDFELPKEELISDKEFNKDDYKDKVGQDIRVMVIEKNPVKFSEKRMAKIFAEEALIEEIKNGKIFEVTIDATNKGGLTGKFGSYQVFVPSSQIKLGFVKDLEKYVGKTLRLQAEKVESRGARKQIVGSQRVILEREKAERDAEREEREKEFFDAINEGDVVIGTPVRFASFGAFIDVNGFDCLAHISDLSWQGCKDCSEVLEIGKTYEFKILKIDAENKRVSVGYKQLQPKPWDTILERYSIGDVVHGKVVRIVSFGAFVEVEKGIDGLVHVSQISNKWLENPVTALSVGQEVDAKILDINPEKEKLTLSIKVLLADEPEEDGADDRKSSKKRGAKRIDDNDETELREWKDDDKGGASIADMLGNSDK